MQLFSSKVEEVSVAISWATISTAWFSRWCFLTKASLAKTAAPAPSDVGLVTENQHLIKDVSFAVQETEDRRLRLSPTLQQGEVFKHLPGVHHLLQTVLILELGIPVQARMQRQFNYNHQNQLPGLLEVIFSYGLLAECLWFFQAILAKCSGLVPERDPNINTTQWTFRHEKKPLLSSDTHPACTIFLHMLSAGIAEHLRSSWSSSHPVAVDHHLHVLVHGIGPVHKLW